MIGCRSCPVCGYEGIFFDAKAGEYICMAGLEIFGKEYFKKIKFNSWNNFISYMCCLVGPILWKIFKRKEG